MKFTASLLLCATLGTGSVIAGEKPAAIAGKDAPAAPAKSLFALPPAGGQGHRTTTGEGDSALPVVVVRGTPYDMGRQLGTLMREEMHRFIPAAMKGIAAKLGTDFDTMRDVWTRSAAFADDRVEQELAGLSDGSGLPLSLLQAMHAAPLLLPYSCSSIAAWGPATENGHLIQTRNLDWSLEVKAHEFPVIVVYIPDLGVPHVLPTFAGMIGAHTGMNLRGIALSEMGDSPGREMPYDVHAPHFTVFFRTMLYDAENLTGALDIFRAQPLTKRYHYVFGDGLGEKRAVKIRAHAPEPPDKRVAIWKDNDPADENAPHVLPGIVYNDEGRGAFPFLKEQHGKLTAEKLNTIANAIPIKGGSVEIVIYDATALKMWVSYAKGDREAWERPATALDLRTLDADKDGRPDLAEAITAAR